LYLLLCVRLSRREEELDRLLIFSFAIKYFLSLSL
jgi:hypothetical protein